MGQSHQQTEYRHYQSERELHAVRDQQLQQRYIQHQRCGKLCSTYRIVLLAFFSDWDSWGGDLESDSGGNGNGNYILDQSDIACRSGA